MLLDLRSLWESSDAPVVYEYGGELTAAAAALASLTRFRRHRADVAHVLWSGTVAWPIPPKRVVLPATTREYLGELRAQGWDLSSRTLLIPELELHFPAASVSAPRVTILGRSVVEVALSDRRPAASVFVSGVALVAKARFESVLDDDEAVLRLLELEQDMTSPEVVVTFSP